jgi:hypothetical protein
LLNITPFQFIPVPAWRLAMENLDPKYYVHVHQQRHKELDKEAYAYRLMKEMNHQEGKRNRLANILSKFFLNSGSNADKQRVERRV